MSLILKPKHIDISQLPLANLTQYLCVVLSKVLESYNVTPKIKWPNDVMINENKISGILAECIWNGKDFKGLVLGVGVNLNYEKEDFTNIDQKATSLNLETGQKINRDLVNEFFKSYDEFMQIGFPLIKKEYVKRFLYLNREICVNILNNRIYGKIIAINDDGTIDIVEKETLCVRRVNIGDLTCQTL
ncbi:MAG: biotin--[acetyl-CoA-carboxylase] ligase [Candidatus Melainabacteria bacterium LEY3_CP_29_8]|nr:MAG: biotin--[acetyl-CoA-carboxylase] ligase [Candidatus Melainabacteria bacterium LEY3_CP_29_8]